MTDETPPGGPDDEPKRKRKPRGSNALVEDRSPADTWYRALIFLLREPIFALSNKGEVRPSFEERERRFFVHVTACDPNIGVAQITDADILIFAASKVVAEFDEPGTHTANTLTAKIEFSPYDLLAALRRPEVDGGKAIKNLEAAFKRLKNTHVRLCIRDEPDQKFTLLEDYHLGGCTGGKVRPVPYLIVPRWFLEQVAHPEGSRVIPFNPDNFDLDGSNLERFVASWAVGYRGYEAGKPEAIKLLRALKLSGMKGKAKFLKALKAVVELNRLPDHTLKHVNADRKDDGDLEIDVRRGHERKPSAARKKGPQGSPPKKQPPPSTRPDGNPDDITGDASMAGDISWS